MTKNGQATGRSGVELGPHYKWVALSNTTLGMLMATINQSIVLIALPDIFRGIKLNPLEPGNTSYLLWMLMGFMVVTAVLVVSFGRLGDMYGRVRMYNLGFLVFTICSILLAVSWMHGTTAALWLIGWRIAQGIGGALLMANSTAILTDAFPANRRGMALGINAIAAIAGSFIGLVLGGVLGPVNWHYVFLVSVPFGVFGTFWAYVKLHDIGERRKVKIDWWGNLTFAVGLIAILVGITYGLQPYRQHTMGWTNPWVLAALIGGAVVLVIFVIIEAKVREPLFRLSLFRNRAFAMGNIASLMMAVGRGGLQFMLIIWLQGIWLPQHGYSFDKTPLWAGIYMIPLTVGFLVAAPLSGIVSDKLGARWFTTGGALITGASLLAMLAIPVNFSYGVFAVLLIVNGLGSGMFASPNRAEIMNSVPADQRGVGAGMSTTFMNASSVMSIGVFFSLMVAGLSAHLPTTMHNGLVAQGVDENAAQTVSHLPPIAVLFAAFLGYNPMQMLLGPALSKLPAGHAAYVAGRSFFPHLITDPFHDGLKIAFGFAIVAAVIAAVTSLFTGTRRPAVESLGAELAGVSGQEGVTVGELVVPDGAPHPNGSSVAGVVHDGAGHPVPGAVITLATADGRQLGRAESDPHGRYAADLSPGDYLIIASAPERQPAAATVLIPRQGATMTRNFTLATAPAGPTGAMYGVIRSPYGAPLAGITATVTDATGQVVASTVSDHDGGYRVTGLADGHYTLVAGGHRPVTAQVRVEAGTPATVRIEVGNTDD